MALSPSGIELKRTASYSYRNWPNCCTFSNKKGFHINSANFTRNRVQQKRDDCTFKYKKPIIGGLGQWLRSPICCTILSYRLLFPKKHTHTHVLLSLDQLCTLQVRTSPFSF